MKNFDYFYDVYLTPVFNEVGAVIKWLFDVVMIIILYLTCPIWVIPYLIIKRRKNNKTESEGGKNGNL